MTDLPVMSATERAERRLHLLERAGWADARAAPLAADASFRSYQRLHQNAETAVLMDAPPPREDVGPFIAVADWLRQCGFSAPRIMAADEQAGFVLLEDLGDALYDQAITEGASEPELYEAAVDLLVDLQSHAPPGDLPHHTAEALVSDSELLTAWFLPHAGIDADTGDAAEYMEIWRRVSAEFLADPSVVVLRDYMADNLIWLPDRAGLARVGLLDFQGALIGSPAYDLVSLLRDVRRDVPDDLTEAMIRRFLAAKGLAGDEALGFRDEFAILGVQRNARIVAVFSRLAARDGKTGYLDYMPRVWRLLERDLDHPAAADLRRWFDRVVPKDKRT